MCLFIYLKLENSDIDRKKILIGHNSRYVV